MKRTLILLLLILTKCQAARLVISVNHTKIASDLTDFPLLISESSLTDAFWNQVKDGTDIYVTNNVGTELASTLVGLDKINRKLELWVKTNLSSTVDTRLYLYFGLERGTSFIWFSDSHNEPDTEPAFGRYYQQAPQKIAVLATLATSLKPDFIISTGDTVDFGASGEATLTNLATVQALLAATNIPYYLTVGNHDFILCGKEAWLSQLGLSLGYRSFDYGNYHFIMLDTNYDVDGEDDYTAWDDDRSYYIPETQRTWLTADLAANSAKPCIVFTHQRIDAYVYSGSGAHNTVEDADGQAVRAILEAAGNVKAVFQGHTHDAAYSVVNGIPYYNIAGMVDGDITADANNNAFGLVRIMKDGLAETLSIEPYYLGDDSAIWKTPKVSIDTPTAYTFGTENVVLYHFQQIAPVDSSQAVNNGTNTGLAVDNLRTGKIGESMLFEGGGDRISIAYAPICADLEGSAAVTVSALIKPDEACIAAAESPIFAHCGGAGSQSYLLLSLKSGYLYAGARSKTTDSLQAVTDDTTLLVADTWYHVSAVINYTAKTIDLYVNGAVVKSGTSLAFGADIYTTGSPNQLTRIGSNIGATVFYTGLIDELKLVKTNRSTAWLLAESNNQNTPATFYSAFQTGNLFWPDENF
jgi:predicted phosphodiesterase